MTVAVLRRHACVACLCALVLAGCGVESADNNDAAGSDAAETGTTGGADVADPGDGVDGDAVVDTTTDTSLDTVEVGQGDVAPSPDGLNPDSFPDASWGDASPLALAEGWTLVDAAQDPFATATGPEAVPCTEAAIRRPVVDDEVWLEVETLDCNAAALRAASLLPVAVGDRVEVRVWRYQLIVGDAGYELSLHAGGPDGELLWARSLDLPGESGLWVDSHIVAAALPVGTPLWWRVRNHGVNSWNLIELSVRPLL